MAIALYGCARTACPAATLAPRAEPPTYALVASDYMTTAIGLFDEGGDLQTEAWMDSGTFAPHLVAALSGDVSLPTAPIDSCRMAVIDRFGVDVISVLDFCTQDEVLVAQIDARSESTGPAYRGNPQDVLRMGDVLYASRFEPSLAGQPIGDDLMTLDAITLERIGRVDLSGFDQITSERFYARPARLAALDAHRFVVALARLSFDFMVAGDGAVALIDDAQEPALIELPGLANCADVVPAGDRVLVACQGDPFTHGDDRRARAGLVLVDAGGIVARWNAIDHPDAPDAATFPVALDSSRALAIAMGDLTLGLHDRAVVIDLADGTAEVLFEADDAFVLGTGAFDPVAQLLLIPDAARGEVRRFAMGSSPHELDPVVASPCRKLPPRELRRVR